MRQIGGLSVVVTLAAAAANYLRWVLWAGLCVAATTPVHGQDAVQGEAGSRPPAVVNILMRTELGDIQLALEVERAPVTAANFLRYVDEKRLAGLTFYRAMRVDEEGQYALVQAGLRGDRSRILPPIAHEPPARTGLSHVNGAISMAREGPGTADIDFFIIIGDLVSLDGDGSPEDQGYAVFGRVTDGMPVVRSILEQPRDPQAGKGVMKGQMLAPQIKVLEVRRQD